MARQVLFDRFMSAKFLKKSSHVEWNCEAELQDDDMHLLIPHDRTNFERIFRYKLAEKQQGCLVEDLEISLEVGLEHTGTQSTNKILFTVASDEWAIGIQLQDLSEYYSTGPYLGYEGKPGRVLSQHGPTLDKEVATYSYSYWPRYFRMTFKPLEKVAVCRTPADYGHLLTVVYDKHNPVVDITKSALYLDVYRFNDSDNYTINYIKATATIHINP